MIYFVKISSVCKLREKATFFFWEVDFSTIFSQLPWHLWRFSHKEWVIRWSKKINPLFIGVIVGWNIFSSSSSSIHKIFISTIFTTINWKLKNILGKKQLHKKKNAPSENISLHCIVELAPLEMFRDALLIGAFRSQRKVLFWHPYSHNGLKWILKENKPN